MSLNKEIFVLDTSRGSLFFAVGNARLLFYHMGVAPLWICFPHMRIISISSRKRPWYIV